jgi:hypothetical protein
MFFQSSLLTDHSRSHPAFAIAHVDLIPTGACHYPHLSFVVWPRFVVRPSGAVDGSRGPARG